MEDNVFSMLRYSAGVASPLRLKACAPDGKETHFEIAAPFALIGRGEGCDIFIPDRTVSYRHAYLQAIGNRVACMDLYSVSGTSVEGPDFHGWLSAQHKLHIGGWTIELTDDIWECDETLKPPLDFRIRDEHRPEYGLLPQVDLELLNTKLTGQKWPINRVITLLGRNERCRITILDERLSRVHCSFLVLPSGLWVIDLLGKGGIQVDNTPCRCMLLSEGSELQLGRYRLAARYAQASVGNTATAGQPAGGASDFLTRQNKIFAVEYYQDTLIVVPLGDSQTFFYKDIHVEASRVMELLKCHHFQNVVIDFGRVENLGHIMLESLFSFCRAAPGKCALCNADSKTYSVIKSSQLVELWHHYANRHDALQAVYLPA